MTFAELIDSLGVYGASFIVGCIGGLFPVLNTELFLLVVSPMASESSLIPIALLSALGQMAAKSVLFYAGRGVFTIKMGKYEQRIEDIRKKISKRENAADLFIFFSATSGFPPFYVVSVVAGSLKLNFMKFFVVGIVGRAIRFIIVILFPQLVLRVI